MSTQHITECPYCQARFRVSLAQLGQAAGKVRCGQCQQVFDAARQLGLSPAPAAETPPPAHPTNRAFDPATAAPRPAAPHEAAPSAAPASARQDQAFGAADPAEAPRRREERLSARRHEDDAPPARRRAAEPTRSRQEPRLQGLAREVGEDDERLPIRPPRQRRGLWWSLGLLGVLAVLAQYLYLNFDTLARQDQWRPWLERLCPTLGCSLPSRVDVEQLRSSNLSVGRHPRRPGVLVAEAVLYNRAGFTQPLPVLELQLLDSQARLLHSQRFRADEYLSPPRRESDGMPPQIPIHIGMELMDPRVRASSYRLHFHSPD